MSDLYLEHHGIKGQKWGVRRFQNEDGSLTDAGKQRYSEESNAKNSFLKAHKKEILIGAAAVTATMAVLGGVYLYKKTSPDFGWSSMIVGPLEENLDRFGSNTADISLRKGTKFQRISSEAIEDYTSRGHTYVSHMFRDNLRYRDRMPGVINTKKPYVHTLKTNTAIKAPSRRKAAEIYLKLNPDATHAQYKRFMTYGIRDDNSSDTKAFREQLFKLGYNALIDENDAGSHWTTQPMILLNPNVTVSNTHKLSTIEKVVATYAR